MDPVQSTLDEWPVDPGAREIPEDTETPDAREIHGTAVEAKARAKQNAAVLEDLVDMVETLTDDVDRVLEEGRGRDRDRGDRDGAQDGAEADADAAGRSPSRGFE